MRKKNSGEYSSSYDSRRYQQRYGGCDRRGYSRYDDRRRYDDRYDDRRKCIGRRGYSRYDDRYAYDDYDDFENTTTGKLVSKMTKSNEKSKTQKTIKCSNVKYDSCCKSGVYKNIRTGELKIC